MLRRMNVYDVPNAVRENELMSGSTGGIRVVYVLQVCGRARPGLPRGNPESVRLLAMCCCNYYMKSGTRFCVKDEYMLDVVPTE